MANDRSSEILGRVRWLGRERVRVHLALLTVQLGYGGYYVLTKAAMTNGVNRFVFAVYRDCIGLLLLAPLAFFSERSSRVAITWPVGLLIIGLGLTGVFLQQTLFLAGLALTNTAFAAAMQNSIPVFTFLIAVICRVEVIRFRKSDGIAKVIGILACVSGATVMSLYQGPKLLGRDDGGGLHDSGSVLILGGGQDWHKNDTEEGVWVTSVSRTLGVDQWQLGSLALIANCFCMAFYTNLQVPALRRFPAPMSLTALSIFVGTIALIITGILTVSDPSEWVLAQPGNIISVVYAGSVASGLNFSLQTWSNHRGGPVLLAAYIPLQAVFSAILGLVVLDDPVNLGTVIGAVLILAGLYLVIWGQRQQHLSQEMQAALPFSAVLTEEKEPLLSPSKA